MANGDLKDLTGRTASDKVSRDKEFKITKNLKYDGYQRGIVSIVYNFLDKKTSCSGIKNENISNKKLSEKSTLIFYR